MSLEIKSMDLNIEVGANYYADFKKLIDITNKKKIIFGTDEINSSEEKDLIAMLPFLRIMARDFFNLGDMYDLIHIDEESYINSESVKIILWEGTEILVTVFLGETIFKFNFFNTSAIIKNKIKVTSKPFL